MHARLCAFGTEKTDFLKILKKNLRFSDNLYGKLTCFVNFHEISSIISGSAPKVLPLKENSRFLHQFLSVLGGGGTFPLSPRYATAFLFEFSIA